MDSKISEDQIKKAVKELGEEILLSEGMAAEKGYLQHGLTSVYEHSFSVAVYCLKLSRMLSLDVDESSLVRGALLHDYFLYDWHVPDKSHRLHGFTHPQAALRNAERDFSLNHIERNMISSHMFPLGISLPIYRESIILCISDKICATGETAASVSAGIERLGLLIAGLKSGFRISDLL